LAALTKLEHLDLSRNRITAVPDSLATLTNLEGVDLHENQITAIPDSLAALTKLGYFNLQISAIPDSLAALTNLEYLHLYGNRITAIPDSLAGLPEALRLELDENPLPGELAEVAGLGWERLRGYLKERAQKGVRQWKVKLLLVGEGGVGKTNLLRRLEGEIFQVNLDPTHSLEIRDLLLPHPSEAGVMLECRAWDFGGQDFYHATHQFFYSGKSVFLLVWNARENIQQGKLTSWLDRIQALAPDSPVLLVATWADKIQPNIPLAELKEKYPQVVDLYAVDNESGNGVDGVRAALQREGAALEHVGQRRPASWVKATEAIRQQSEPYAEFSRFRKLADDNGVTEFDTFAEYLCHTGEITFFPRNPIYQPEQAELRGWVVLKPDWLLQNVSHLLTDPEIAGKAGIVRVEEQRRIWHDCSNLVQEFLLRMMDHFDLAYRTETHPVHSIVVELSPEDRPADVNPLWEKAAEESGASEVALEYRFETTIPPGLPTWFIARSHRFTTPERHWRRGALMSDEGGRHWALLQADLDGRKVALAARGPVPQNFFALLRDCFEGTLRRFPGLLPRVERVVPCPKRGCKGDFKVSDLEAYLAEVQRPEDEFIRCHGCRSNHWIASLLFGIRPAGLQVALQRLMETHHQELLSLVQREFTESFHREQSLGESHCPSVFTLELERLPDILPSQLEAWWRDMTNCPVPACLTLYCEQPGEWHPVKSYRIEPPGRRLVELAPPLKKLAVLFKAAGPLVANPVMASMAALAEAGAERWGGRRGGQNLGAGGIPVGETRGQAFAFCAAPAFGGNRAAGAGLLGRVGESGYQAVSLLVALRGTCEAASEGVRG
jgi:hypothetical protein